MFKETGHENVDAPSHPGKPLQKEKDHVEGFAKSRLPGLPGGGQEKLTERLCVRPTSEVLFCEHYSHIINSYRICPCCTTSGVPVVRVEKTTRPFLRTTEFYWVAGGPHHA